MRMVSKRTLFNALLFKIRQGLYTKNSIQLSNYGLRDNDLSALFEALNQRPALMAKITEIDICNYADENNHVAVENRNEFTNLSVKNFKTLSLLRVSNTNLTELNLENLPELKLLIANSNGLTKVTLKNIDELHFVDLNDNQLTEFDALALPKLDTLWLANNQLKVLNVSELVKLKELHVEGNPLQTLVFHGAPLWSSLRYNSQLFDNVTRLMINAKKPGTMARVTDYAPAPDADDNRQPQQITLTNEDLEQYFAIIIADFKKHNAPQLLTNASKAYLTLAVAQGLGAEYWDARIASPNKGDKLEMLNFARNYARYPQDLSLQMFACNDFEIMCKKYFHKICKDLTGYIDPVVLTQNQKTILAFRDQQISASMQPIFKTGMQKLYANKSLQKIIQASVDELKAQTRTNVTAIIKRPKAVLFRAPSLPSMLKNSSRLLTQVMPKFTTNTKQISDQTTLVVANKKERRKGFGLFR